MRSEEDVDFVSFYITKMPVKVEKIILSSCSCIYESKICLRISPSNLFSNSVKIIMIFAELLAVKVHILLFRYASLFGNCIQTSYCQCSAALSSSCVILVLGIYAALTQSYNSIGFILYLLIVGMYFTPWEKRCLLGGPENSPILMQLTQQEVQIL